MGSFANPLHEGTQALYRLARSLARVICATGDGLLRLMDATGRAAGKPQGQSNGHLAAVRLPEEARRPMRESVASARGNRTVHQPIPWHRR